MVLTHPVCVLQILFLSSRTHMICWQCTPFPFTWNQDIRKGRDLPKTGDQDTSPSTHIPDFHVSPSPRTFSMYVKGGFSLSMTWCCKTRRYRKYFVMFAC